MTYYELVNYIENLKRNNISEENLQFLENYKLTYTGDIKIRYLNHIVALINYRLNSSIDNFLMKIRFVEQNSNNLVLEINYLKNEIKIARRLANLKDFDNNTKKSLLDGINSFGDDMNNAIKDAFVNTYNQEIKMIINNLDVKI